jgi:hypothetical protein
MKLCLIKYLLLLGRWLDLENTGDWCVLFSSDFPLFEVLSDGENLAFKCQKNRKVYQKYKTSKWFLSLSKLLFLILFAGNLLYCE